MILSPTGNNIPNLAPTNIGGGNSNSLSSANVSSRDLASSSQLQSVNVSLSASNGLVASTVAGIPPIYSKPTVAAVNQAQVSPSRSNASSDGLAENSILSGSKESEKTEKGNAENDQAKIEGESKNSEPFGVKLSENELKMIEELKLRDREVKAHEQAHKAVGGQYTGAISYTYQSGPDGKRYAVGGEVPIDVSPIAGDPQATITKMTIVKAAATAPAEPSTQDLAVAAQAAMLLTQAQADLAQSRAEGTESSAISQQGSRDSENRDQSNSEKAIGLFVAVSNEGVSNNIIDAVA